MMKKICIAFFLLLTSRVQSIFAEPTYTEEATLLQYILKYDAAIREHTGEKSKYQYKRNAALKTVNQSLKNIEQTWNAIPTTDKTLQYTLGLQKYKLSCEISAIRTLFFALGKKPSEDSIIKKLPHFPGALDPETGIWGDPDREFVGSYTGSQREKTGYGIYESAIADFFKREFSTENIEVRAWNKFTRDPDLDTQSHLSKLLTDLDNGRHTMLWGDWCTDPMYEDGILGKEKKIIQKYFPLPGKNLCANFGRERRFEWKTQDGKTAKGVYGDHVFVLLGYIGDAKNPTHIIVWDTDTGRHIYPIKEWMRKWNLLDNRSLTVWKK